MNNKRLIFKKILKLLLLVSWMMLIFILSHQNGNVSSLQSDSLLKIFPKHFLFNKKALIVILRKLAHIIEYFVLFILIFINLKEYRIKKIYKISFMTAMVYAFFDEFHQIFITDRSGSIIDVLIDAIGIITACIIIKYINNKRLKFKQ